MSNQRPIASLSLDLDNKWSYLRVHGDAGWEEYPSYLDVFVPRFLAAMEQRGLKITVFIVGRDAGIAANQPWLKAIADAGHEIGNHSFDHQPWLHLYSQAELEADFDCAEQAIEQATGHRPTGFRGPGFSLSQATLEMLVQRGYRYDASTLPTYIGPLARAYYFMTAKMSSEERAKRDALFGSIGDGLRPVKPFRWRVANSGLLEIPVTTMPILKLPFHLSYLAYLAQFSPALASAYLRLALAMCRATATQPSILLHPLDFLGREDAPELGFFPGMRVPAATKLAWSNRFLDLLQKKYRLVSMQDHADWLVAGSPESRHLRERTL